MRKSTTTESLHGRPVSSGNLGEQERAEQAKGVL